MSDNNLFNSFFTKNGKKLFIALPNELIINANNISLEKDYYSVLDDTFINKLDENQEFALVQLAFDHFDIETNEKHKRCKILVQFERLNPLSVTFDLTFECWNNGVVLNDTAEKMGKISDYEEIRIEL